MLSSEINTYKPACGAPQMGYTISDETGKVLARGYGFLTPAYVNHAVQLRKRALMGLPPLAYTFKEASKYTMDVVQKWNDNLYSGKIKWQESL
jgi:hypothetical protein